jgi:hypothetical protein
MTNRRKIGISVYSSDWCYGILKSPLHTVNTVSSHGLTMIFGWKLMCNIKMRIIGSLPKRQIGDLPDSSNCEN